MIRNALLTAVALAIAGERAGAGVTAVSSTVTARASAQVDVADASMFSNDVMSRSRLGSPANLEARASALSMTMIDAVRTTSEVSARFDGAAAGTIDFRTGWEHWNASVGASDAVGTKFTYIFNLSDAARFDLDIEAAPDLDTTDPLGLGGFEITVGPNTIGLFDSSSPRFSLSRSFMLSAGAGQVFSIESRSRLTDISGERVATLLGGFRFGLTTVPEPSSFALAGLGLIGAYVAVGRRRRPV